MGSRLKQNPERTFYWFFEATCPIARDKDPGVLFQFPDDFSDEESCQTSPKFCFPYDIQRATDGVVVQHFTFVLTDLEGCQRFGFCRLNSRSHTCLCILSYLPWFEVFYKLLNTLADYLLKGQTNELKTLLAALHEQPIPPADGSVPLQMGDQLLVSTEVSQPVGHPKGNKGVPYFIAPDPRNLPSIPENRNLTELIVTVHVENLLQIYASMLFERRILIFASKLSTLTACVHAISAVLYPMYWQHIFIPVLPPHLLDYCCAPMPYLIGVHTSLSERVRGRGLEEVVILNVDTNTLETPFDDLKRIPSNVMSRLKVCLKRQAVSPGCGVSRAFLKAQAVLFGGYRDALQLDKEGEMWFSKELFLDNKSSSMSQFLQSAIHSQSFKQFIDGRLDVLNREREPDDLFEEEILNCETTAGRNKSYQQLVGNLKKGGGALIFNMRSKANMRAKGLTKSGLKNLLMHKSTDEEVNLQRGGSVSNRRARSDCLQNRLPITKHFGMSRPRRPVHRLRPPRDRDNTQDPGDTWDGAVSGPAIEPILELLKDEEDEEESPLCDPEEMDLLGEIFDTLSSRSSHERGLLYGTRSLDLFGPDSHDYITKRGFPSHPSQESLSLSVSGSGSLHSWSLDTTEELCNATEDTDWPEDEEGTGTLSAAVCHTRRHESREVGETTDEVEVAMNGNKDEEIDNSNNIKEVKAEEGGKDNGREKRVSMGEEEKQEDFGLTDRRDDERNESEESAKGKETDEGTNRMEKSATREDAEGEENPENRDKDIAVDGGQGLAEDKSTPMASHDLTVEPETSAGQEGRSKEAVERKEERGEPRQTFSSPKVLSAAARFQSQALARNFQVKSRAEGEAEPGRPRDTHQPHDPQDASQEQKHSKGHDQEEQPPIKVSELKKRFEA